MLQQTCLDLVARAGGDATIALQGNERQIQSFLEGLERQVDFGTIQKNENGSTVQLEKGNIHFQKGSIEGCTAGVVFTGNEEAREQEQEEAAIHHFKVLEKPFVLIADDTATEQYCLALAKKHATSCFAVENENCTKVIEEVFATFPLERLDIYLPDWIRVLPEDSTMIADILSKVHEISPKIRKMEDCVLLQDCFQNTDIYCETIFCDNSTGTAQFHLVAQDGVFYKALSQSCGETIQNDIELMDYITGMKEAKEFYTKFKHAVTMADQMGYGIVLPSENDLSLQAPELFRKGTKCGVKLRGEAPSYHIIKVDMQSEVTPITGENERSESMAKGVMESYEKDANTLWDTNMFGKTFRGMVQDGLDDKIHNMPESARIKLRKALTRIINEGKGGVLCILL